MMRRPSPASLIAATLVIGLAPAGAAAAAASARSIRSCACCTEPGTWYEVTRRITPEELAEIGRMNLGAQAYVRPARTGRASEVTLSAGLHSLRHERPNRRWKIELTDPAGRKGELSFLIPDEGTFFAADLQDGDAIAPGEPLLYKEWRIAGPATGSGILKGGTYRLVFQGRGGACPNAGHFDSWILSVVGGGADNSIFGRFAPPRPPAGASSPLYFESPAASVGVVNDMLRREDWTTLARYYDMAGTAVRREDLDSGRFFLEERRPPGAIPGVPWRTRHPFALGSTLRQVEDTGDAQTVRLTLQVESEPDGGSPRVGIMRCLLRRSELGYQLLPVDLPQL